MAVRCTAIIYYTCASVLYARYHSPRGEGRGGVIFDSMSGANTFLAECGVIANYL